MFLPVKASPLITFESVIVPETDVRLPSVKLHVAVPEDAPVAVTEYTATNEFGRLNWSEIVPSAAAVTSTSRLHVWPASSLTLRCTASPGAQLAPESVTCSPGA